MKRNLGKIIFMIGALCAIGMIYLLAFEETSKLFYILLLISLSAWPLAQYISWRKKKSGDTASHT